MRDRKIRGLERIRSMHSSKQRSIPKSQQNSEIELFLLEKEKERFVKEAERLQVRLRGVYERISVLQKEIETHHKLRQQKQAEQLAQRDTLEDMKSLIEQNLQQFKSKDEGGENWTMKKLMY